MSHGLGRKPPEDWEHVDKFPLTAAALETITVPTPVIIGVNWYSNFDNPVDDAGNPYSPGARPVGHWWIGRGSIGRIRGGHCVVLKPKGVTHNAAWWDFYDQGSEGACVGFGGSQMMTMLNRKRYFARWLWDRSKEIDYLADTNPGDDNGTSVKAALDVLRTVGHVPYSTKYDDMNSDGEGADWAPRAQLKATASEGIAANRWVRSMDDMLDVLGYTGLDYCDIINNWGRSYPHLVRIPVTTLNRLWQEDGEFGVVTDR